MVKKKVGFVTFEERDEIQKLYKRHSGLTDLAKIISVDNVELYEKVVCNLGETYTKFQDWWNKKGEKYNWESAENGRRKIDFESCEIYLVTQKISTNKMHTQLLFIGTTELLLVGGLALLFFGGKKCQK